MLNCLVHRQHNPFLLAPCLQFLLVSVSTNEAIAIHPCHHNLLSLLSPKWLHSPPLKHWKISLAKIAAFACRKHVPTRKMRAALALRNNVINRKLFFPFPTICTGALPKWSPQKIVFKNTLTKSTFCISRAKFNERIKQLIRTIRSWHGTIKLSCP